jgi:uncharacterized protein (DUF488 family)
MFTLYTIGHSSHTIEEFISILHAQQISHIVDVRTIPKSRYVPWFNANILSNTLKNQKIAYTHMPELGGLRKTHKDSINQGWRNASFRGFADYMQTIEFYAGLKKLNQIIKQKGKVAIMCAEAVPWQCHRSLIADAEIIRGVNVINILNTHSIQPHALTPFAVVDRAKSPIQIYYPK